MKPLAVIFDMDGLLLDSEPLYRVTWQTAAAELGCPIDDAFYARFVGRGNEEAERLLRERFGEALPLDEFRERWQRDWDRRLDLAPLPRKPGAIELLDLLESLGMARGLATSTPRSVALRCLGDLAGRFAAFAFGDEVTHSKPAPDLFLLASQRLGVEPGHCLVLEDSEAGVRAARAAGMEVIIVPDLIEPPQEIAAMARHVCRSLHDVRVLMTAIK
ncbi:MAG TPA: HAD family phosphatase [Thermoanaerobaculia bacterium]|nr:HAD family phosphatase [Thermoanaerobaculia bacterium]